MNYRLNGFGFLGGQQVKDGNIGNLGLLDQREAHRWVQRYIAKFGGDPKKVTMCVQFLCRSRRWFHKLTASAILLYSWGESAGAISVALQMLHNKGHQGNLFRAAFMNSGSPIPVGNINAPRSQAVFDFLATTVGCGSNKTLACMRTVSYEALKAAIDQTPAILSCKSLCSLLLQTAKIEILAH